MACMRDLVPLPGIEPGPPALGSLESYPLGHHGSPKSKFKKQTTEKNNRGLLLHTRQDDGGRGNREKRCSLDIVWRKTQQGLLMDLMRGMSEKTKQGRPQALDFRTQWLVVPCIVSGEMERFSSGRGEQGHSSVSNILSLRCLLDNGHCLFISVLGLL